MGAEGAGTGVALGVALGPGVAAGGLLILIDSAVKLAKFVEYIVRLFIWFTNSLILLGKPTV